jgi:hypothetical protein
MSEITEPPTDPVREAKQRDLDDPADVEVDQEVLRQGGPTRTPGAVTTTGGRAGPAMRHATGQRGEGKGGGPEGQGGGKNKVAPTTTGDATSGGMDTPTGGTTSDATTSGDPMTAPGPDRAREAKRPRD